MPLLAGLAALAVLLSPLAAQAQLAAPAQSGSPYQGSVATGQATADTLGLTLDDAVQRGLRANLGILLSGTQTAGARGQQLSQLQSLLPSLDFSAKETVMQVDLAAQGLRIKGFPTIIGPFGYTDIRATLNWSVVDMASLQRYMAARHNFAAAQLSAADAREMVVFTVVNAYLVVLADQTRIDAVQAQSATAKVSLDQAQARHSDGTAPQIDELRARVDAQSIEQQLIVARNALEKDKLSLARVIGLPLDQRFSLADQAPFAVFDQPKLESAIAQARTGRKDLAALNEQVQASGELRKAATDDRLPALDVSADYGDIGVNVRHSHGTGNATGTLSFPLFREFALRGQAQQAQSRLDTDQAKLADARQQVEADVRDALLDIESSAKQVEVARSSVDLATEALSEAQQRYSAGVSDNLPVSQAQQSLAQANDTLVVSLYRNNIAKLSLARALGAAEGYKVYLGGK